MNFWDRVNELITKENTSYSYIAGKIGKSESTVSGWHRTEKKKIPEADLVVTMAQILHTTVEYLVTGKPPADMPEEIMAIVREAQKLNKEGKRAALGAIQGLQALYPQEKEEKPMYADTQSVLLETKEVEPEYEAFEDTPVLDTNVLPIDYDMIYLPYFGKTAAGIPLDIFTEPGEYMPFPRKALKGEPEEYFVLSIQGYSMVKADIDEGDMVVIRRAEEPVHGKIMLVRHEGASTLKRLAYRGGKWRLFRNDGSDREIQVDSGGFQVQGLHVWTLKPGK
jgi:SOS-response transcriptional repressor LexA